jgi:membrane protein implicated in regulation of membrane protease activity
MGILLWVLGAVALGAGAIKLRGRTRDTLGPSRLTTAELAGGAVLVAGAGLGLARVRLLAWVAVVIVLVVVAVSAVSHAKRIARRAAERDRTAEQRFRRYLNQPGRKR